LILAEEVKAVNEEMQKAIVEAHNYKEAASRASEDAKRDVQVCCENSSKHLDRFTNKTIFSVSL
jgi:hypothetical protein